MLNILNGFDYSNLNNPEFLEDSVREEILLPLIKSLGYSASSTNKIVRSRKLKHPYVYFGTIKKEIYIIPDYIMEVDSKPFWLLEAKAPNIDIKNAEIIAQAYSYAIHQDVRAKFFLISNGKDFDLYDTLEYKPILSFTIYELDHYHDLILNYLCPKNFYKDYVYKLSKDFGLHLKRLNLDEKRFTFLDIKIPFIARIEEGKYTFSSSVPLGDTYIMTVDFGKKELEHIKKQLPHSLYEILTQNFNNRIDKIIFDRPYSLSITCKLGDKIEENDDEIFLPLLIDTADSKNN